MEPMENNIQLDLINARDVPFDNASDSRQWPWTGHNLFSNRDRLNTNEIDKNSVASKGMSKWMNALNLHRSQSVGAHESHAKYHSLNPSLCTGVCEHLCTFCTCYFYLDRLSLVSVNYWIGGVWDIVSTCAIFQRHTGTTRWKRESWTRCKCKSSWKC